MPRRDSLVSGYLEGVSRSILERPDYQALIRELVQGRFGVYALYRKDRLQYVGLASNLRNRVRHHLKDRHGETWDRFSLYLTLADSHIKELESLILRILRPTGNRQGGHFAKAKNLRTPLARAVRELHRQQEDDLIGRLRGPRLANKRTRKGGKSRRRKTAKRSRKSEEALPPLAGLLSKGRLRGTYKGKVYTANVRRSGKISFEGTLYDSPSAAAKAALGRRMNGWWLWTFQQRPGEWVRLKELRR